MPSNPSIRRTANYEHMLSLRNKLVLKISNRDQKLQVSKLRLSNHTLMIETGRHHKIPKEIRFCPFCQNAVETEIHFLFQCPTYSTMRDILHRNITENNPEFYSYTLTEKLEYLMTNIDLSVAKYINNSVEVRTFLLTHPKRNI